MKDLQKLFEQCLRECDNLGIQYGNIVEVTINTRAKKRWGQTRKRADGFYINISSVLLRDDVSDEAAKDTIMHEILHTVDGCFDHKTKWQAMANKVNMAYGYKVKRCTSASEKGINSSLMETPVHNKIYVVQCENCGIKITKYRDCKLVKFPHWYIHKNCGGKFRRVI